MAMAIKDNLRALRDQPLIGPIARKLMGEPEPLVTVVRLTGVIGGQSTPLSPSLTLASCAADLEAAFTNSQAKAVAIAINSPGGSPVQSALITKRVRALAKEHEKPVFTFIEDVGASGGYMLALAGDEIYADENSVVGSIGVVSAGFGFKKLIDKVGVERRIYTAGTSKAMLDPFQEENPKDVAHLKKLQEEVHESFKQMVRDHRGDKLSAPEDELFNGAFWTGATAKTLGLIDGLGDMRAVMQEKFGDKTKLKLVHVSGGLFRRNKNAAEVGAPAAAATASPSAAAMMAGEAANLVETGLAALEARAHWNRFGL
ncbi:S49 family peptidase [Pyruvatibacter mobilis]|nr:S49 family peptidase [Pyruvatibacter mobilis]QJD75714.1 S49 family peptidase [Pyruvatibacter mobilis]GGD17935.1 peptidase S49 [Pyruvatibacter mobilis]